MVKVLVMGKTLHDVLDEHEIDIDLVETMTVKHLLELHHDRLGAMLPFMQAGEILVTINRRIAMQDSSVKDGDLVKLSYQSRNHGHDGSRDIPT